ncbi:hypothetical protein WJX72_009439 [[Myrmecia] bisecta]|uniref:enoyl-[acyl-carrier-protein] reductase n=1 Tax=[Myrmecia] bisecta TaxID=41462 RepID=A0AAW1P8L9_9CHLO
MSCPEEVTFDILAAPINPSDINTVEGKYPVRPPLPAVPGNEGVGVVRGVGKQVQGLKEGDWVVPLVPGLGMWRQRGTFQATALHRVPSDLPLGAAATMCINPPTALRMLRDFVDLAAGDVVIQNGANSSVGQLVIQMAKARGIHTINLVRDKPERAVLEDKLRIMGATVVTTEQKLREAVGSANLPAPKLALNCVGGSASAAVAKMLGFGGTLVTYGGMSMQPITLPTSLFIFKDIQARGFWLTGGPRNQDLSTKKAILDEVVAMIQAGQIHTDTETMPLSKFQDALVASRQRSSGSKILLVPT